MIRIRQSLKTKNIPAFLAPIERLDDQKHLQSMLPNWWNKFFNLRSTLMESFFTTVNNLTLFQIRIQTKFSTLELSQLRLIWSLIRSMIGHLSNLSLKVFWSQLSRNIVKYEDNILISNQNYIFCGHDVVAFLSYFFHNVWLLLMWLNRVRFYWAACCNSVKSIQQPPRCPYGITVL